MRQPGSVFKVITCFAPAIDTCGATLGTVYYDAPYTVDTKTFRNWYSSGPGYLGYSNIREGIIYSMNIVAVRCMMETVTPQLGIEYAKNLGITSLVDSDVTAGRSPGRTHQRRLQPGADRGLLAIANGGVYTSPYSSPRSWTTTAESSSTTSRRPGGC